MRLAFQLVVVTIDASREASAIRDEGLAHAAGASPTVSMDEDVPPAVPNSPRQRHLQISTDEVLKHIEKSPFDLITTLTLIGVAVAFILFVIAYCCFCRKWCRQRRAIRVHGRTEYHFRTVVQAQCIRHEEIVKMYETVKGDKKNAERLKNAFTAYESSWLTFQAKELEHEGVTNRFKHLGSKRFRPTNFFCCLCCCCRKNLRMSYDQMKDVSISRATAEVVLELALEKRRTLLNLITSDVAQANEKDVIPEFVDTNEAYFVVPLNHMTHPYLNKLRILPHGALGSESTPPAEINAVICDIISTTVAMDGRLVSRKQASPSEQHNAELYFWLKVGTLPYEVKHYFTQFSTVEQVSTKAKLHEYDVGKIVIHASFPKLDKNASTSVHMIAQTFAAIIQQYCCGKQSKVIPPRSPLRLTTFDDERFACNDELLGYMPLITLSALSLALTRLPFEQLEDLGDHIDLCVLSSRDVLLYEKALEKKKNALRPLEVTDVENKQVAQKYGRFQWITKHTTKEDRLARLSAFFDTQNAIWNGGYIANTREMQFRGLRAMIDNTSFMVSADALAVQKLRSGMLNVRSDTKYTFYSGNIAKGLTVMEISARRAEEGNQVVSVNAASAYHCGGGVLTGGRHALEEAWCMTSTLLRSLLRATYLGHKLGLSQTVATMQAKKRGPRGKATYVKKEFELHIPVDGCVLSPRVEVFRQQYMDGYKFMDRPVELAGVVSVAAFNKNPTVTDSPLDAPKNEEEYLEQTAQKWRSTVVGAAVLGGKVLVIPDVGCGVFLNDPSDVGSCLNKILKECKGYFEEVIVLGKAEFCTNALRGFEAQILDYVEDIHGQRSGKNIYIPQAGIGRRPNDVDGGLYADRKKGDREAPMNPPNSPLQGIMKHSSLMQTLSREAIRPDQVFRELDHERNPATGRQYTLTTIKESEDDKNTLARSSAKDPDAGGTGSGSSSAESEVWRDFNRAPSSRGQEEQFTPKSSGASETSRKKYHRRHRHGVPASTKSGTKWRKKTASPKASSSRAGKAVAFDKVVTEVEITLDTQR